jgi:hypothetical protein
MKDYKFSGHETFQCRHFWLKKGYDFVKKEGDFKSNDALIELGVGKNMISSKYGSIASFTLRSRGVEDAESK